MAILKTPPVIVTGTRLAPRCGNDPCGPKVTVQPFSTSLDTDSNGFATSIALNRPTPEIWGPPFSPIVTMGLHRPCTCTGCPDALVNGFSSTGFIANSKDCAISLGRQLVAAPESTVAQTIVSTPLDRFPKKSKSLPEVTPPPQLFSLGLGEEDFFLLARRSTSSAASRAACANTFLAPLMSSFLPLDSARAEAARPSSFDFLAGDLDLRSIGARVGDLSLSEVSVSTGLLGIFFTSAFFSGFFLASGSSLVSVVSLSAGGPLADANTPCASWPHLPLQSVGASFQTQLHHLPWAPSLTPLALPSSSCALLSKTPRLQQDSTSSCRRAAKSFPKTLSSVPFHKAGTSHRDVLSWTRSWRTHATP